VCENIEKKKPKTKKAELLTEEENERQKRKKAFCKKTKLKIKFDSNFVRRELSQTGE
jgi:hypothetical protein